MSGCTNYVACFSAFEVELRTWMEGNVTSLLLHLGSSSMVHFKSKCYVLWTVSKPSRPVDQISIRVLKSTQPEVILEFTIVCLKTTYVSTSFAISSSFCSL